MTILIEAYKLSIIEYEYNDDWEEDDYTAWLVDEYMDKIPLKYKGQWFVAPQRPFYSKIYLDGSEHAKKAPRPDIRFEKYVLSDSKPFKYTIEAKIVKSNSSSLKRRYITTGIENFITKRYPNGCLAGYVLDSNTIDCVNGINKLLRKDNKEKESLVSNKIVEGFNDSYNSTHIQGTETIVLNHIFLEL